LEVETKGILAKTFTRLMIKEICSPDFSSGPQIAAIGILLGLCDKRCRPWVFVSFGPSQKKEPLGGDEPRQDSKEGLLNAFRQAQDDKWQD